MKMQDIPIIRFKRFIDSWTDQKLSDVVDYRNGKAHENAIDSKGKFIVVNSKFVSTNGEVKKKSNNQIAPLLKDELAFVLSDVPNGRAIARIFLVDENDKYTLNQRIAALSPKKDNDSYFLSKLIDRNDYFLKFDDGVKQTNLKRSDVEDFVSKYPKFSEQTQIGNFFKTLDEQINLQEQKYQKLVNLKKAMLEKMFPKEGADTPEIRFKGFSEKWDFVELGNVLEERKIIQKISKDAPILAFAAGQGVIDRSQRKSNNRDHLTKDASNKKYLLTEFNDIVYNPSNLKYGAIDRNKHGRGVISPIYVTFITEQVPSFIELIVKGENFKIKALQYEEGTVVKRQSVKPENLLSLKVFISQSLEEQQKIGDYFENLDNLIQQAQQQLEKHKNIKQALLKKMFV
ncbi:restriction endonuclease subunit S [Chryseobacterium arthrosphaerae]|uniref:restriction endonuclease subunit S n=1 Tax=Chryseobacterium arthrosphaerae TaxID=651561 RepID=UPI0023E1B94F|nr:restriction endonuclease subunit S [Chryseobacterium arthrosphaerae]WES98280.1 restriction endonuclease subunit S [Chryseobacterium arthrosphaerae]